MTEYEHNGITCPVCGSSDTSTNDTDGDYFSQAEYVSCNECDSAWVIHWKFEGIHDIEENKYKGDE